MNTRIKREDQIYTMMLLFHKHSYERKISISLFKINVATNVVHVFHQPIIGTLALVCHGNSFLSCCSYCI